jgi:hypothetical protein
MTTVTSAVARRTADSPATPAVLGYAVLAKIVTAPVWLSGVTPSG